LVAGVRIFLAYNGGGCYSMLEIPTFLIILAAGVISFISMPLVIKIAYKLGAVDKPEARKVHQHTMPRLEED
jgi:UDP-N-acetylmuramyl pentapeptide phosphotransferase/UDP-N-acetylglucosamine-1-phosphate transferase